MTPLSPAEAAADRALRGWRGPALAAAVAFAAAVPGLLSTPALDPVEARTAEVSAQLRETRDLVDLRFQTSREPSPAAGLHALQAATAALASRPETRPIAVYRLPSLAAVMLAAAACAWGVAALAPPGRAALAGALTGASLLAAASGGSAAPTAVLGAGLTLALAALGRLHLGASTGASTGGTRIALWGGATLALMAGGVTGVAPIALALLGLVAFDRDVRWMRRLGWSWGLAWLLLVAGPWAAAAAAASDGAVWAPIGNATDARARIGAAVLLAPAAVFPTTLLLPAAALAAWRRRDEAPIRFGATWLLAGVLGAAVCPAAVTAAVPPLAWLSVAALDTAARSRWARVLGAGLTLATAAALAAGALVAAHRFASPGAATLAAAATGGLALAAAAVGAGLLWLGRPAAAATAATAMTVAACGLAGGVLLPRLEALWVSARAAALVQRAGLDPRNGVTPGPVAVLGDDAPGLVFALGTGLEHDTPDDAAISTAAGQPLLVEARQAPAFRAALAREGVAAEAVGSVSGYDLAARRPVTLTLWRAAPDDDARAAGPRRP